jgi:methionyl-tRNA synthetase
MSPLRTAPLRTAQAEEVTVSHSYYVTTPIYYVNDRPHIGSIYSTLVADVLARYRRQAGAEVFFLTGTDEHAPKVAESALAHGVSPHAWADRNAAAFEGAFASFGISNDDFIRTTQPRHVERVREYLDALLASGDVYPGRYEGWYDPGQEEYIPETRAAALDYRSAISGRPLVRRDEDNYFFRLSAYADDLLRLLEDHPDFVQPEARRNEALGRVREGLHDIPISRTDLDWGIRVPGDERHTVYVWIDALFNYVSAVDTPARRHLWPADVHVIGKEILWFHAVIWPALLLALRRRPGYNWLELPRRIYAHSFWVSDGQKMSKSLGNVVDLDRLAGYQQRLGLDGLRYFLATNGPLDVADRDFTEARLLEVYNAELANLFGNLVQRAVSLVARYAGGVVPVPGRLEPADERLRAEAERLPERVAAAFEHQAIDRAAQAVVGLITSANRYAEETAPWQRASEGDVERVSTALYHLAETARLASWHLWPFIPDAASAAHRRLAGLEPAAGLGTFGAIPARAQVVEGPPLFPRIPATVSAGATSDAPTVTTLPASRSEQATRL